MYINSEIDKFLRLCLCLTLIIFILKIEKTEANILKQSLVSHAIKKMKYLHELKPSVKKQTQLNE